VAVLSFLNREMAAGLLLLLLRASSGLRQTLSELVSHLLCVLHPNQVYNVKRLASRTLEQAFVGTLRCTSCLQGRYN
jgi:hypothetical protein